jgi:DNA-binding NarL/FixJ family response regulator
MTIRVLLVDDQALLRSTFRLLIDSTEDIDVVGEAGDGRQAVELAEALRPDVVLMDIRMPELDGIAATEVILSDPASATKVLMLTTFETEELIMDALRAGASGYLGKGVEPAELLEAIRVVASGEALLSAGATRALIARVLAQPSAATEVVQSDALAELTPRETEILTLVGLGLSNDDIAAQLVISPVTAKTHVNRTMSKLGLRDRAQLVIAAYEAGLVVPGQRPD